MIDLIKENNTISHHDTKESNEANHSWKWKRLSKECESHEYSDERERDGHENESREFIWVKEKNKCRNDEEQTK